MKTRNLLLTAMMSCGFLVGCPGDEVDPPRPGPNPTNDGGTPDGGPDQTTGQDFSAFVIDLIQNKTADDSEPVAIPDNLTNVETEDPAAFDAIVQ